MWLGARPWRQRILSPAAPDVATQVPSRLRARVPARGAGPGASNALVFAAMKIAILGSGAVGGYYGARLARSGHEVVFVARGAHLAAIRERGLEIRSAVLGDFVARARAEEDTARIGPVDLVIVAVKAYDNPTALPLLRPLLGDGTAVLTVQNGVDSPGEVAAVAGDARTLGGTTYVAAALEAPGVIVQTGD